MNMMDGIEADVGERVSAASVKPRVSAAVVAEDSEEEEEVE